MGFALIGYLESLPGDRFDSLFLMPVVLVAAWGLGYWISKAIQKRAMWPRAGYVVPRRDPPIPAGFAVPRRDRSSWTLIGVLSVTALAAAAVAWLEVVARRPDAAQHVPADLLVSLLGIGLFACLVGAYVFWFCFNGRQDYPWKWLVVIFMALGFVAIGLPVRFDYLAVWPQTALFNGIVWVGSGLATLCCYLRHVDPAVAAGAE